MIHSALRCICVVAVVVSLSGGAFAQQAGSLRGVVYDKDFDAPLAAATVLITETGEKVTASDEGIFTFGQLVPGGYTLVFSKEGYSKLVKSGVVVSPGKVKDVGVVELAGDFTDMEEFVVQSLTLGGSDEASLLNLRLDSPGLLDSIGADLMSRAGAGDAAAALKLVSGATVQDGKFAVIRGLPDRYVSSQMNGVRLPTADVDKRAVQLDQFPSAVIESVQVSKTFTPDQQGDASGGAVNVVLKGVPDEGVFEIGGSMGVNTQTFGSDFLSYRGGGVGAFGTDNDRDLPSNAGTGFDGGAVGVSFEGGVPFANGGLSMAIGGKHVFENGMKIGAFMSTFYDRGRAAVEDGEDNSYWVLNPGVGPLVPQQVQRQGNDDFKTALYDVTTGTESVQWGSLGLLGLEINEENTIQFVFMQTHAAEDKSTLSEDTRGAKRFDPTNDESSLAPQLRTETLTYTERRTQTAQLSGKHSLAAFDLGSYGGMDFGAPEIQWIASMSSSEMDEPDKRQFGSLFSDQRPDTTDGVGSFFPYKPEDTAGVGHFQRIYKDIVEDSEQLTTSVKLPFTMHSGRKGYFKAGVFYDRVQRAYNQDSFTNDDSVTDPLALSLTNVTFKTYWSSVFPSAVVPSDIDVDYDGKQSISAAYWMFDMPMGTSLNIIGGFRLERTEISIVNDPEDNVFWIPPSTLALETLEPGEADVFFDQDDLLPSLGAVYAVNDRVTLRASYSETVARQTFKELTPIQQSEFLGGDVFVGNPSLQMSSLQNYDVRVDYTPYEGGLFSFSAFHKEMRDPIEYVSIQGAGGDSISTVVNYPEGVVTGIELELRQDAGRVWERLEGLAVGINGTLIESEVTLSAGDAARLAASNVGIPITTRHQSQTPEHLLNFNLTYDHEVSGMQFGLFYTVRGDTLVVGDGVTKFNYVPAVYEKEVGTLSFSVSKPLNDNWKIKFQAKNLTDPDIQQVYRSDYVLGGDVVKSSFRRGIDLSLSIKGEFRF